MPPGGDPISANSSMLNPADLAGMKGSMGGQGGGTVREFLAKVGIDVDGPVDQLVEFGKKQLANRTGMGKMKSMAGGAPPPGGPMPGGPPSAGPPPGGPMPSGPPPGGGLKDLLG